MITRRGLLAGILAAGAAPAIVASPMRIWAPRYACGGVVRALPNLNLGYSFETIQDEHGLFRVKKWKLEEISFVPIEITSDFAPLVESVGPAALQCWSR